MNEPPRQDPTSPYSQRIKNLLDMGRLRRQPATREQVAAVWRKTVESARDAALVDLSVDGSLRSAYDAGHLACQALLAAHGLRSGGVQGHHEATFAGAAALGHDGLDDLVPDSIEIRGLRRGSLYDPMLAGPADRDHALAWMRRTLPLIRAALVDVDPALNDILEGLE
jgi:hypothetical protein